MIINNIGIFKAMAKNINSPGLNRSMIGYTIKEEFGPSGLDEIKKYSEATGDDFNKYAGESSPAPPFFFSRKLYPMFKEIMTHKDLKLDILRMVHGMQGLRIKGFVAKDASLSVEMTIADIVDTPAGEMLLIKTKGFADGKSVVDADTGFIVRRKKKTQAIDEKEEIDNTEIDSAAQEIRIQIKTFKGQQKKYAKVSRDTNPIHTSEFFARLAGLPGTILHGVCVMAMCANSLIDVIGDKDSSLMDFVSARFSYPVIPGDVLTLVGKQYSANNGISVDFDVFNNRGKAVVKKGEFHIAEKRV
ncbi:MAG: MaoC/PaaZ C-terminal domain-containing protein [Spirochaetota bacterium]